MAELSAFPIVCVDPLYKKHCAGQFPGIEDFAYWEGDQNRYNCKWGGFINSSSNARYGSGFLISSASVCVIICVAVLFLVVPWKNPVTTWVRKVIALFDVFPHQSDPKPSPFSDDMSVLGSASSVQEPLVNNTPRKKVKSPIGGMSTIIVILILMIAGLFIVVCSVFRILRSLRLLQHFFCSLMHWIHQRPESTHIYRVRVYSPPVTTILPPNNTIASVSHIQYHSNSDAIKLHMDIIMNSCSMGCKGMNVTGNVTENYKCIEFIKNKTKICHASWDTPTAILKDTYGPIKTMPKYQYVFPKELLAGPVVYRVASYVNLVDYFANNREDLLKWGRQMVNSSAGSFILTSTQQCMDMVNVWDGIRGYFRRIHIQMSSGLSTESEWSDRYIQGLFFSDTDYPYFDTDKWHDDMRFSILTDLEPLSYIFKYPSTISLIISVATIMGAGVGLLRMVRAIAMWLVVSTETTIGRYVVIFAPIPCLIGAIIIPILSVVEWPVLVTTMWICSLIVLSTWVVIAMMTVVKMLRKGS